MSASPPPGYPRVSPYLYYEDVGAMMEWLGKAFGMTERHATRDSAGNVLHAEMAIDDGVVMMGCPGSDFRNPKNLGQLTSSLYVYVDDVDAHCARAREAGAELLETPADQPYGDRRYGVRDPEGQHWYFASRNESG